MKKTKKSIDGTFFHGTTINATLAEMREILGEPCSTGNDKSNFNWFMETEGGEVFTVYDWKYYRSLVETEKVDWHIGAHTTKASHAGLLEILEALAKVS